MHLRTVWSITLLNRNSSQLVIRHGGDILKNFTT